MKSNFVLFTFIAFSSISLHTSAQGKSVDKPINGSVKKHLYIDVHQLEPGKVKFEDVAKAHAKDLAVQKKYGVNFIKYWVNEEKGLLYCLSSSVDSASIRKAHAEAHGLLPASIFQVTDGTSASENGQNNFFLDVHYLGAGKVSAKDVAAAHAKDLAVEKKHNVNFINYWVDEKSGTVFCLSQAPDSNAVILTHKEAHGLIPARVLNVKQGE
ncbi:MAG: DUF4242 domain-containing protein [Ferruginibacter sp.]